MWNDSVSVVRGGGVWGRVGRRSVGTELDSQHGEAANINVFTELYSKLHSFLEKLCNECQDGDLW